MVRSLSLDYLKLVLSFMIVALYAGFLGEYSLFGQFYFKMVFLE